ncbi:hypothetical protein [Rhizobium sp. 18065]|uniref:hypothetical protein n=1 Tax=Rhizobium sp. 18065 TaxID=2681411 RepID=UPI001357A6F5|nr:hypothetical protein [Rhizobium sp. 18065]
MTHAPLNAAQIDALQAFAADYGRGWKAKLSDVYWYNARIWRDPRGDPESQAGYVLHGLRNSHGPSWLMGFKLPPR